MGFLGGSDSKELACNEGDLGLIPGLGRSPGEGKGCPLKYSGLENSIDCIVHGVTKSRTQLSDFHFHFSIHFEFPFVYGVRECFNLILLHVHCRAVYSSQDTEET